MNLVNSYRATSDANTTTLAVNVGATQAGDVLVAHASFDGPGGPDLTLAAPGCAWVSGTPQSSTSNATTSRGFYCLSTPADGALTVTLTLSVANDFVRLVVYKLRPANGAVAELVGVLEGAFDPPANPWDLGSISAPANSFSVQFGRTYNYRTITPPSGWTASSPANEVDHAQHIQSITAATLDPVLTFNAGAVGSSYAATFRSFVPGPTISNGVVSANGQTVSTSCNVVPINGTIQAVTVRLDSVPPGQTVGPFAMALGTPPSYAYQFTNVSPGTFDAKVIASDNGATSPATTIGQVTIAGVGGNPQAPNPLTGAPVISFVSGNGTYSVLDGSQDVCLISLSDADHTSGHTWQLAGADSPLFEIVPAGLQFRVRKVTPFSIGAPQDQGQDNTYALNIRATDPLGNMSNTLGVSVSVTVIAPGLPAGFKLRANTTQGFSINAPLVGCWTDHRQVAQVVNNDAPGTPATELIVVGRGVGLTTLYVQTSLGVARSTVQVTSALPNQLASVDPTPEALRLAVGATYPIKALLTAHIGGDLEGMPVSWALRPASSPVGALAGGSAATQANAQNEVTNVFTALQAGRVNVEIQAGDRVSLVEIEVN